MIVFADFSGGLNLRDSPTEIAANETPEATNWTLDQRGALTWRKGCTNVASLPGVSGKAAFIFYSAALDQWLCARETAGAPNTIRLHTRPGDLSGSWTDRGSLMGGGANLSMLVSFVDWPGQTPMVVVASAGPTTATGGATQTWDGTTLGAPAGQLAGNGLAVWQNRVWRIGYPVNDASGNLARLFASKVGDPSVWTAPDGLTVDIRDKDASRLTGIGIAGGRLIVFKRRSAYAVTDSATGAYTTIDSASGAQGPLAVVPQRGRLYTWGADSLYEWDGVGPGKRVGDKARPLFATDAALVGGVPALCGGVVEDRVLFAYPSSGGGTNDLLLEFDPGHGWLMKHSLASSSKNEISSFASKEAALYGAVRDGDVMFQMFAATFSGTDDVDIQAPASYRTRWLDVDAGKLYRIIRAQLAAFLTYGGGAHSTGATLVLRVYKDGDTTSFTDYDVSADVLSNVSVKYGATATFPAIIHSLGHARTFAFEFVATYTSDVPHVVVSRLALDPVLLER